MNKVRISLIILAILGICVSGYALYLHYATSSGVCHFNSTFDCDLVNKSDYAEILGIPVAVFGILGYAALWIGTVLGEKKRLFALLTLYASIVGFLFALYLTGLEIFVIKAYCIVCLSSQAIILAMLILSIFFVREKKVSQSNNSTSYESGNQPS